MPDSTKQKIRKRRFFRFSLRTLLIVLTFFGVVIGPYMYRAAERQRVAVTWVQRNGGFVAYPREFEAMVNRQPYSPTWLHEIFGVDYFSSVVEVEIPPGALGDLKQLAGLVRLKYLYLRGTEVNDLTPMTGLTSLEYLDLEGTQVSDLSPLSGMTELTTLHLSDTNVSDLTPLSGMTELLELCLEDTNVSDLAPLSGLRSLEYLDLQGTQVTNEEIKKLQRALPDCSIVPN